MNEIINKDSDDMKRLTSSIDSILDSIDGIMDNYQPFLNGRRFMTDDEVSKILHISRRTLQDYRSSGKIPYYQFGGKILYEESDIERILKNGYKKEFD